MTLSNENRQSILATVEGGYKFDDFVAAAPITPGEGLEFVESNGETQVQPVSTAGKQTYMVAREQRNPPRAGSGKPVDQSYDAGDRVEALVFRRGDEVYLRFGAGADLAATADANFAVGDTVGWYSDGTLSTAASTSIGVVRESIDNSGASAGENPLGCVEFF